jgi:hypothetical protein
MAVPAVVLLGYREVNKKILTAVGKGGRIGVFFPMTAYSV